jgi:hypothetical protein
MSNSLLTDSGSVLTNATEAGILNSRLGLGDFAPGLKTIQEYMPNPVNHGAQQIIADYSRAQTNINNAVEEDKKTSYNSLLAEKKRRELEEAARLKAGEIYRKANPLLNADGSLKQDSALELGVKMAVNKGLDVWNTVNDYVPFVEKKTLDIDSRLTGTVAGMAHENLGNKDFSVNSMTKKQVLDEVNTMQDDPNGQGTLYYLRKADGKDENGNDKFLYKVGFAQLDAADRYRSQANAAGWDIVKEVQNSGSAELEKKVQTKFIGDRALSYDQVKGADGKWQSRDKASGINFGSGYGEIYSKDILGWDKKPTKGDVSKYKINALKAAVGQGLSTDQLKAYRTTLDAVTPEQLQQMQYDENKRRSYEKRDKTDAYQYGKDDGILTAMDAGISKFGREAADVALDIITPESLDRTSMIGNMLGAEKGDSTVLNQWKTQDQVDKDVGYNRRSSDEAANAIVYHWKKGDYVGAVADIFTGGAINMTAESLGYMAPMLVGSAVAGILTGGGSTAAQGAGLLGRAAQIVGRGAQAKNLAAEANMAGNAAKAAEAGKAMTSAAAELESTMAASANTITKFAKGLERGGFLAQTTAMTNERIDQRIANNGGQPTSLLENAMVFLETGLENYVDRAIDMSVLGIAGHKELQGAYRLLDDVAKKNLITRTANIAVALSASAGVEGATEYLQNIGQTFAEQYDTKKNGGTIAGILGSAENQEDNLVNFLMGVAGGVHMQSVPTGLSAAGSAVSKLAYKYGGKQGTDEQNARMATLIEQISNGTADPHNNPISLRGDKSRTAVADIHELATSAEMMPAKIAYDIMAHSSGDASLATGADGKAIDPTRMIRNLDASLRTTFKIDANGNGDVADQARYENTLYRSAMQVMKHVVESKSTVNNDLAKAGYKVDNESTNAALSNVLNAYKEVLPAKVMEQIDMLTTMAVVKELEAQAIRSATDKKPIGEAFTAANVKGGGVSVDIDALRATVGKMDIIMGSMSSGSDSYSGAEALESIKRTRKFINDAMQASLKSKSSKAELGASFFDQAKKAADVGSEILFKGKTDDASGKLYGKGIFTHAEDVISDINNAVKADGNAKKISEDNIGQWLSFAMNRVKTHDLAATGHYKDTEYLSKQDLYTANDSDTKYGYNYIPQMDRSGKTAARKIAESKHMINVAEQAKTVLEMAEGRVSKDSASKMLIDINSIITKSKADIAELEKHLESIQRGSNDKKVLVNLRNIEKRQKSILADPDADASTKRYAQRELDSVTAEIAKAIAESKGKFSNEAPIYAYRTPNSKLSKVDAADFRTYTYDEQQSSDAEEDVVVSSEGSESKAKAPVGDNIDETEPKKTTEDKTNEQDAKSKQDDGRTKQASGESSASTEDTKSDKSGTEKHQEGDAGKQKLKDEKPKQEAESDSRTFAEKVLDEANDELARLQSESVELANAIADEAGVEFKYDLEDTLGNNLKALRKAITVVVNGFKKTAKAELDQYFTKSDKLSTLLTSAIKGIPTSDRRISKNDSVVEATVSHATRATSNVSSNTVAKQKSHKAKVISRLLEKIDGSSGIQKKLWLNKLAKVLDIPVPKTDKAKRDPQGFAKTKSNVDNETEYNNVDGYQDPWEGASEEDIRVFEEDVVAQAEKYSDYSSDTKEPEMSTEETVVPDEEESIDKQAIESDASKEAVKLTDKSVNMFMSASDAKDNVASKLTGVASEIDMVMAEMKAKRAAIIDATKIALRAEWITKNDKAIMSSSISKEIDKEAKKIVDRQMEEC